MTDQRYDRSRIREESISHPHPVSIDARKIYLIRGGIRGGKSFQQSKDIIDADKEQEQRFKLRDLK